MWGLYSHSRKYRKIFLRTYFWNMYSHLLKHVFPPLPPLSVWIQWLYSRVPDANTWKYFGEINFGANTCGACIRVRANTGKYSFGGVLRGNTIRGNRPERFWEGNRPLRGYLRGPLRGMVSELFRAFQRFLEVFRGFQRFSEVFRGFQRFFKGPLRDPLRVSFSSQSCGSCCPSSCCPLNFPQFLANYLCIGFVPGGNMVRVNSENCCQET